MMNIVVFWVNYFAGCVSEPHCTENPIFVFPEVKLRGLVLSSYIHVFVSNKIYSQDRSAYLAAAK
jgi:hypothetical protein